MTIEEFKVEIQFWKNLELIRYKTEDILEIEALNQEIAYRVKSNINI